MEKLNILSSQKANTTFFYVNIGIVCFQVWTCGHVEIYVLSLVQVFGGPGQAYYEGEEWEECQYLTELIYSALASWYMKPLSFKLTRALYSIVS